MSSFTPEQLVRKFANTGNLDILENSTTTNFILCYRKYISSTKLFTILTDKVVYPKGIFNFLKIWIAYYFERDFWKVKHGRSTRLKILIELLNHYKIPESNCVKLSLIRGYHNMHKINMIKELPETSSKLFSHQLTDIAEQLTLLEYSIFKKINIKELTNKYWIENRCTITVLLSRANEITNWIAGMILSQKDTDIQARVLRKFILIAEFCEKLGNYNTLMEILSTLDLWAINRLKGLWKLEPRYLLVLARLRNLASPTNNFKNLRNIQDSRRNAGLSTLPYLGIFLRDLTFIEDGNTDILDGKVNLEKISLIGNILSIILDFQAKKYKIKPKPDILRHLISKGLPEETINNLSTEIKPYKGETDSETGTLEAGSEARSITEDSSEFVEPEAKLENLELLKYL